MPRRIPLPRRLHLLHRTSCSTPHLSIRHASALATTPTTPSSPPITSPFSSSNPPISHHATTQPLSHRPPELRKSQLIRQYASLLQSNPLILLFQHNNLKSTEWMAIRRELAIALRKVDTAAALLNPTNPPIDLANNIKLQTLQTGIFAAALRLVEYYTLPPSTSSSPSDRPHHLLSHHANSVVSNRKRTHPLSPLLFGPLTLLTFPAVSPAHLSAALSILSPHAPRFPAPKRRTNPGYHDPPVQAGLQKLLLLGARVEGQVFDLEGIRGIGSIEGGMDGLRAQIVAMLQSAASGLVQVLAQPASSVYMTLEARRIDLAGDSSITQVGISPETETETETETESGKEATPSSSSSS